MKRRSLIITFFAVMIIGILPFSAQSLYARGNKEAAEQAAPQQEQPAQSQAEDQQGSEQGSASAGTGTGSTEGSSKAMIPLRPDHKFAVLQGWNIRTGKELNATYLQKQEYTIVNIWSNTCPACMEELPKLAELKDQLPDNAALLGISLDAARKPEESQAVLDRFGIEYPNIAPHPSIQDLMYEVAPYIPSTLLLNKNGKIVSGPHYGVQDNQFFLDELAKL